jgi:DNA polymerase-4
MRAPVFHFDADAFFAAVEQASDPRLRGKPVAVGGERRGIIASASYEARAFGVRTPMPTARARRLCPQLILIPGDYEKYERFSRWMFSYLHDFTPRVEVTSIDEGYADFSGARQPPLEIARTVQRAIRESLRLSVSEGLAANKLVSQVASKLRKPGGLVEVPAGEERAFLAPLAAHWLPGVGEKTGERLRAAGLALVSQVAETPVDLLRPLVGSGAELLRDFARGHDPRPLVLEREAAKSIGRQHTYAEDVTDESWAEARLRRMADEIGAELRAEGQMARTFTVKVRYNDFAEDQHAASLAEPTDLESDLYGHLSVWLRAAWRRRVSLRLVALRASALYPAWHRPELPLFPGTPDRAALRRLAAAVDTLRSARGPRAVLHAHDLLLDRPPRPASR